MTVRIDYTKEGMKHVREICGKYGIKPAITINGTWIHELSEEQYKCLEKAEQNGYLRRTIL